MAFAVSSEGRRYLGTLALQIVDAAAAAAADGDVDVDDDGDV